MCHMNKWVEETQIWRDKLFSLVSLQKILEEQRRLKREQEEADAASRRHTGIVPTHHQFITNERFGDLLNITDNTERRKSGIEVLYRALSYPSVSRKRDGRCFQFFVLVRLWGAEGLVSRISADTDGFGGNIQRVLSLSQKMTTSQNIFISM